MSSPIARPSSPTAEQLSPCSMISRNQQFQPNMSLPIPRPSSPTDKLLSPCSMSLFGVKKSHKKHTKAANGMQNFSLEAQVRPQPSPVGDMRLILGTASTCRRAVVDQLGWDCEQIVANIDEKAIRHDDPLEMPILIAKAKASVLIKRHDLYDLKEPALLITADQIVLYRTNVREKPENLSEATEFLSSYSNDAVSTVSAIVVTHLPSGVQESGVDIATVYWKNIPEEVVARVVERGEVLQSAGGFKVEDPDLNPLVKGIDRPVDSVMGFPVDLVKKLMLAVTHTTSVNAATDSAVHSEAQSECKHSHK